MVKRIYAVDAVDLSLQKSLPANLLIEVSGRTATPGWRNLRLVPFAYAQPPADGVQDYDVTGDPPVEIAMQVLTRVCADLTIPEIDIDNYWGPGLALLGVRCHAQSNSKERMFEPSPGMAPIIELPDPTTDGKDTLSFQRDIRPLFRAEDIRIMIAIRNLDLSSHTAVSAAADVILVRLEDGTMPCDGPWPETDIDMFRNWIAQGKAA